MKSHNSPHISMFLLWTSNCASKNLIWKCLVHLGIVFLYAHQERHYIWLFDYLLMNFSFIHSFFLLFVISLLLFSFASQFQGLSIYILECISYVNISSAFIIYFLSNFHCFSSESDLFFFNLEFSF